MRTSTFSAILGNRDQNCRCKTLTQFYQRVANWSNEELQGRTIQADKESHKENILSEKAAKKSHEESNCELHETDFKQLIADVNMTFQRIRLVRCTLSRNTTVWCTNALIQLEEILRDESELRFKIPHTGIIENQNKSMPRETEKH